MPVVPIRKEDSRGQGFSPMKPLTPPDESFTLMAAAQMHAEGRLIEGDLSSDLGAADLDRALKDRKQQ